MSRQEFGPLVGAPVLDPDSPEGREVAAFLSRLRDEVEDRLEREAREAALTNTA